MLAACSGGTKQSSPPVDLGLDLADPTPPDFASLPPLDMAKAPPMVDLLSPYDLAFMQACTATGTQKQQFVVDTLLLPQTRNDYAFDLDGNGVVDNQLGNIVGALTAQGGPEVNPQTASDQALAAGHEVMLIDELSTDPAFLSDACAASTMYTGKDQVPAPGIHAYQVDPSLMPGAFTGPIATGSFVSAPNSVDVQMTLRLTLFGAAPIPLPIHGAHLRYGRSGANLINGQINGAILNSEVQDRIVPAIAASLDATQKADPSSSQSKQILAIFDQGGSGGANCVNAGGAPGVKGDGTISPCEVAENNIIKNVLAPDVQLFQNGVYHPNPAKTMKDSVSVGIYFTAVPATF